MQMRYAVVAIEVALMAWLCSAALGDTTESPSTQSDRYSRNGGNDLPALARASALAEFDLERALDNLRRAEAEVPSRQAVRQQYRVSQAYQTALQELREAQQAYNAGRKNLLARLQNDAAYREAMAKRDAVEKELERLASVASIETRIYLAERKLKHASEASRIRMRAEQGSPEYRQVETRLASAQQALRGLQEGFDAYYEKDPAVVAALAQVDRAYEAYEQALRRYTGADAAYAQAVQDREAYLDTLSQSRYDSTPWWIYRSWWRGDNRGFQYFRPGQGFNFNITGW